MLKEWISRPDLGGGIPFSGRDLNPKLKHVYDDSYADDIMILNNRAGESDLFTQMLAGPVFHRCEKVLRYIKVRQPVFSRLTSIPVCRKTLCAEKNSGYFDFEYLNSIHISIS